ncbi:CDK1 [Hepatospora eriocheir]|uniref:cyclin-dependent kinase n=1 Tax=Hepatospora eriocheir TaxID=1081669 RepID=A0A1X0QK67_9MICR|nr:CDK1 [Hepatospora eriocheir]
MFISEYKKVEKIGKGAYGIVYKAIHKETGKVVAIKKIKPSDNNEGIPATTIRETIILKNLKHENIIGLDEVLHDKDNIYLVFEYIDSDLKKLIERKRESKQLFNIDIVKSLCKQLVEAVTYCHNKGVFHRDIKPHNILINYDMKLKLADFGLSRSISIPMRAYSLEIVTLWYRPPEILLGTEYYDASIDVWSLACIMYEIYTTEVLFKGDSEISQLEMITKVLGSPNPENWPNVKNMPKYKELKLNNNLPMGLNLDDPLLEDLLLQMLEYDPLNRITAEEVLSHDFFN